MPLIDLINQWADAPELFHKTPEFRAQFYKEVTEWEHRHLDSPYNHKEGEKTMQKYFENIHLEDKDLEKEMSNYRAKVTHNLSIPQEFASSDLRFGNTPEEFWKYKYKSYLDTENKKKEINKILKSKNSPSTDFREIHYLETKRYILTKQGERGYPDIFEDKDRAKFNYILIRLSIWSTLNMCKKNSLQPIFNDSFQPICFIPE